MADNKTWSMQDLDKVFPETNSEKNPTESGLIEIAKASKKPAYHNSFLKAALLLGGGGCLAVIGALLFSLTGSKSPEKVVATVPEAAQPTVSNDGWEIAAKQSAADAGQAINIPDSKKVDTPESPSPSPSATTAKADSKPSPTASVAPKPTATPTMVQVAPKPKPATLVATAPSIASKNVATKVKPSPIAIAQAPKPTPTPSPVAKAAPQRDTVATKPSSAKAAEPANWEQASNMGTYGGEEPEEKEVSNKGDKQPSMQKVASNYDGPMSPVLLMAAGTNVKGHTLAPFAAATSSKQSDGVLLSIALDEPINLSQGYKLPIGTTINFVATVRDNGSVVATSKNANIGGVDVQLPEGALFLASENNDLLMAKEINPAEEDLTRADINNSILGGIAGAGKAILNGGATTTTSSGPLGTVVSQTNNGNPNILGGALEGAFTGTANNAQKRAQQKAEQLDKRSRISVIGVNTRVRLFVNAPVQVQIPVTDPIAQAAELPLPQQRRLITSRNTQIADAPQQTRTPSISEVAPPPPLYPADTAKPPQSPLPPAMQKALQDPARTRLDNLMRN